MSAIFISHSSVDSQLASDIAVRLEHHGHRSVFLDFDPAIGIPAGRSWEKELYARLRQCSAIIVICSDNSMDSKWCFAEITHAKALGKYVFPIKITDCEIQSELIDVQIIDMTSEPEAAYARLFRGLDSAGLDPTNLFDWDGSRPPYPGLMAFDKEDAAIFFGREAEIQSGLELLRRLRRYGGSNWVVLSGASGSGKSSLLRAGLLPRLQRTPDQWVVVGPFRPRQHPLDELAIAWSDAFESQGVKCEWQSIRDRLDEAGRDQSDIGETLSDLVLRLARSTGNREVTVIIAIDQLEELLAVSVAESGERFFIVLRSLMVMAEHNVLILGTLRSDFFEELQRHPAVRELPFQTIFLGPIPMNDIAKIIEGPAELASIELESGLVQAIVDDTETDDALPLLAFTLRELWERHGNDGQLSIDEYRVQLGGLEGSVARAADAELKRKPPSAEELNALKSALVSMVRVNEAGKFTRRPKNWMELPERSHDILERFVQARLLVSRGEGEERQLEVAHEALFRSWTQLKIWLDEDREFLLWHQRVRTAVAEWKRTKKDQGTLLRGAPLTEAERQLTKRREALEIDETSFVQASIDLRELEEQAKDHRRRKVVIGLVSGLVFMIVLASAAGLQWRRAAHERSVAEDAVLETERRRQIALAGRLATKSQLLSQTAPANQNVHNRRLQLTAESLRRSHTLEGYIEWSTLIPEVDRVTRKFDSVGDLGSLFLSSSGSHLASVDWKSPSRIWSLETAIELVVLSFKKRPEVLAFSADGSLLATFESDNIVRLWDLKTSRQISEFVHPSRLYAMATGSGGAKLATARDSGILLWDLEQEAEPILLENTYRISKLVFSPDGSHLVAASSIDSPLTKEGIIYLWDTRKGVELFQLTHDEGYPVWDVAYSNNGKHIASVGSDGTARVWDVSTGEEVERFDHDSDVRSVDFSPDGNHLATVSTKSAHVWSLATGQELVRLNLAEANDFKDIVFSIDGTRIVTSHFDDTVRLWVWQTRELIDVSCSKLKLNFSRQSWRLYLGDEPYMDTCPGLLQEWDRPKLEVFRP